MKPIWIAATALAVALAVAGCKNRKEEPVPGPNATTWPSKTLLHVSALPTRAPAALMPRDTPGSGTHDAIRHDRGASGISWFQGSFEEAFSIACSCHCYHFGLKN